MRHTTRPPDAHYVRVTRPRLQRQEPRTSASKIPTAKSDSCNKALRHRRLPASLITSRISSLCYVIGASIVWARGKNNDVDKSPDADRQALGRPCDHDAGGRHEP